MKRMSILAAIMLVAATMAGPVSAEANPEACMSCREVVSLCKEIASIEPSMGTHCPDLQSLCESDICTASPAPKRTFAKSCLEMLVRCPEDQPKCIEVAAACMNVISSGSK